MPIYKRKTFYFNTKLKFEQLIIFTKIRQGFFAVSIQTKINQELT